MSTTTSSQSDHFSAIKPWAISREIERGTDMRQPEVCMEINYMAEQDWVTSTEIPSEKQGRPNNYLAIPVKFLFGCFLCKLQPHLRRFAVNSLNRGAQEKTQKFQTPAFLYPSR